MCSEKQKRKKSKEKKRIEKKTPPRKSKTVAYVVHLYNSYLPYIYMDLKLLFRFASNMGTAWEISQICQIILYQNVCVKFVAHGCPCSCFRTTYLLFIYCVSITNYVYQLQLFIANLNTIFIYCLFIMPTRRGCWVLQHKIVD